MALTVAWLTRFGFVGIAISVAVFAPGLVVAQAPELDVDASRPGRMILHVCKSDGTPIRPLINDKELRHKYDRQGTPDVSADGLTVAFDAWSSKPGAPWQDARIIVAKMDGSGAKDICDGVMPCFSPDASQLVVSRTPKHAKKDGAVGQSIWVMKVDGSDRKMITDRGAWGARWSPDGRSLVFHGGVDDSGAKVPKNCLRLYDFASGEIKQIFSSVESPFTNLVHHFEWGKSPNRLVAFGGPLKGGQSASAVIDVDKGIDSLEIVVNSDDDTQIAHGASLDWHPTSDQLLVTAFADGRFFPKLLPLDYQQKPGGFPGLPNNVGVRDPIFTPDAQQLIASLYGVPGR